MINKKKELVYICSPLRADTAEEMRLNILKAREQMEVVSEIYNCRAIAPHAILPDYLDDNNPEERALGIKFGLDLLKLCKLVVVCGDVISEGMRREIEVAKELGIDIIYRDIVKGPKVKITIEVEGD